ncbi:hypothetical protein NEOLEDRAFT_1183821 [Neolentinus lepideus HHB14362 ss-1]|uniref:BAH domain-containing protein n=1 Tax=Neolentinus lepideus HHB14362 ss-1 TaxID=1314782 RepID=A0A165MZ14_9AGAM|nr:hypothetical protein NEOLEDRAFT_1183821 [Neolentinus lepideus HHB14362 ss-1]
MVEPPAGNISVKPVEADQEEVYLFIGRDVFVYPPEMEITNKSNTNTPQKLWKAKILELEQRTSAEQERHKGGMARVQWYYSPGHLIDLGVKLVEDDSQVLHDFAGACELVLSDHKSLIPLEPIASFVEVYCLRDKNFHPAYEGSTEVQALEPDLENHYFPTHQSSDQSSIPPNGWYYRRKLEGMVLKGVNKHCTCQTPYNLDRDRQQFCQSCSTWFHIDCMEPVPDYPSEEVVARKWEIFGSGSYIDYLVRCGDDLADDWGDVIDKCFEDDMAAEQDQWYQCPTCSVTPGSTPI